jgi:hypothetical protein
MKPRDLFLLSLQAHVVPVLADRGFRFRRSKLDFVREVAGKEVRQRIEFQLSRWNGENCCEFWSSWSASSPRYVEWHRAEWDEDVIPDTLAELADWNIPGWSRGAAKHSVLQNLPADADEWAVFLENAERAGFPFLERISSWAGAAEQLRQERWHFDRAADFLLLAGERDLAREVLLEGVQTFETAGRADNFRELPRLHARLKRYFPA